MEPRCSIASAFRFALIASVSLVLANCAAIDRLHRAPVPVRMPPMPPPEAQEIPLQEPIIDFPMAAELQPPQIASNVPRRPPPVRRAPPAAKPAAPKEAPSETDAPQPAELVGYDFPAVLQVLRRPDTVQNSALSIVWTYSQSDCMLQLFFYPDIQTKVFRLLKYDLKDGSGEKLSDSSACMRRMMARNDEPALP